jgi:hypothetical protein
MFFSASPRPFNGCNRTGLWGKGIEANKGSNAREIHYFGGKSETKTIYPFRKKLIMLWIY